MDVRFVDADGVHLRKPDDVVEVLAHDDGFFWIDVPAWDDDADALLEGLGCHPLVRQACERRNFVPTLHGYDDHAFITMQAPLLGSGGHVHLLELDLVVGHRYLVTVHGPINPVVELTEALVETETTLRRIEQARFRPVRPVEIAYALGSAVARRQSAAVRDVAAKLPRLEQEVLESRLRDPEALLETMFLLRHELVTAQTMGAECSEVWLRMAEIGRLPDDPDGRMSRDLAAQFGRVRSMADGESNFLSGVIMLYQTKVHTKMTVATERLAVIAGVTLPVTAIASVYGMNMIVSHHTHYVELAVVLLVMLAISLMLLRWARRQGWW